MVEWLQRHACDQHSLGFKPTRVIMLCILGKDTLRHFPLFGGLAKQF